jgi:septal ring factor EnvC (AmiA/AmiB activator)
LVATTRLQSQRIELEQKHQRGALAGIWQAREEANQQRGQLELIEAERVAVLREIERWKHDHEAELLELQRREDQLLRLLAELEQRRDRREQPYPTEAGDFARWAGRLDWPAAGEVIRSFGPAIHPEFKTVTENNGIYISAPVGTPVRAVAEGTVEFADDLPGFGLCIIVDHGGGYYTLYANLARVYVVRGSPVARGEVVAEVGQSLDRRQPQLYFEIRRGRTPLDPAEWLEPRG